MPPYTGGSQTGGTRDARNERSNAIRLHPVVAAETSRRRVDAPRVAQRRARAEGKHSCLLPHAPTARGIYTHIYMCIYIYMYIYRERPHRYSQAHTRGVYIAQFSCKHIALVCVAQCGARA